MRKFFLIAISFFVISFLKAQNVQLHYDFGDKREHLTSTVEMFKPDKLGNTFFFIDMDYGIKGQKGVSMAYWEIARVLKLKKSPVGLHVEYNGGFGKIAKTNNFYSINNAWLAGFDYSWNSSNFSKGFSVKTLFKTIEDKNDYSFQLTLVWYCHMLNKKLSFTGFADFWHEDSDFNFDGKTDAKYIFITEPQLWYNFSSNLSLGSEIEVSNNFAGNEGWMVNPTIAVKWNF